MNRYFPELLQPLAESLPPACILDGEIVIARDDVLDFDALLQRIHPAASRVEKLSTETPASFVAFDLLALGPIDLRDLPQVERRRQLEHALAKSKPPVYLTPVTYDFAVADDWFRRFEGAGLDGVVAKPATLAYQPGKRAMIKVKHERAADCVVGGFRWYKEAQGKLVGSLLLGLYDDSGVLHHVGVTSAFTRVVRAELAELLAPLQERALDGHPWAGWATPEDEEAHRMPGGKSRWTQGKDTRWEALRVERVCEVKYDHLQNDRFRHATTFKRWRPDKEPKDCRYDQLEVTPAYELKKIFLGVR